MSRQSIFTVILGVSLAVPLRAAENPGQNADTFRPSVQTGALAGAETANLPEHLQVRAGAWLTFHHLPVKVTDQPTGAQVALVRRLVTADVWAAIGLFDRLAVGLGVPVFLNAAGDDLPAELPLSKVGGTSLGDLRIGLQGRVFGDGKEGVSVAVGEDVGLPTATRRDLTGDEGVTATTRVVGEWVQDELRLAVNAGYRFRREVEVLTHTFGPELVFGAGASVPLPFLDPRLAAVGSLQGWTAAADPFGSSFTTGLDGLGGAQVRLGEVAVTAAAGGGLLSGFGSPAFRATLAIAWTPAPLGREPPPILCPGHPDVTDPARCLDGDDDGHLDSDDRCPQAKGPLQGCPDGDGDGIADGEDKCPSVVGKLAGCPDGDGDGVADPQDKCPIVAGPAQGCPDTDGDGIADGDDKCPQVPGDRAAAGCPTDRDGDGVADAADKCPDAPGPKERNGCPEQRVTVTKEKIVIADKVFFDAGDATVQKRSFGLLDDIAAVLKKHPEIARVRIEGHTDDQGEPEVNLMLSTRRAESVKAYLIKRGVAAKRLIAQGHGATRPLADNATEEGRASNRRVEFLIVERTE